MTFPLQPSKTLSGGGGGGDRDKFQAPKHNCPSRSKWSRSRHQWVRNDNPKLTAEPTVVVPPQVKLATNNLPTWETRCHFGPPSNGTGSAEASVQAQAAGCRHGSRRRRGPRRRRGWRSISYVGGGVSAPRGHQPDPEYSEIPQGEVSGNLCALAGGRTAARIRVARSLGFGLDEKAIEAVKTWKFEPAVKNEGYTNVEVSFRLY